jgi:hypothetical protein
MLFQMRRTLRLRQGFSRKGAPGAGSREHEGNIGPAKGFSGDVRLCEGCPILDPVLIDL